ncbi:MAG: hypothetical protein H7837_02215 [Magnetococcus sp. MYC-9]
MANSAFSGDWMHGRTEVQRKLISLRSLAGWVMRKGQRKDIVVNVVGGTVLLVVLSVISLLVYLLPDMLAIAKRLSL